MIKKLKRNSKPMTIEAYVACACYTINDCIMACGLNNVDLGINVTKNAKMAASLNQ